MKTSYLSFKSKRNFGVEIEVNRKLSQLQLASVIKKVVKTQPEITGWGYTCGNKNWVVKPDSSCGDYGIKDQDGGGFELASPVGKGPKHLEEIAIVANSVKASGGLVNDYCGLHCQVSIADFDDAKAAILLAYWCRIEPMLTNIVPTRRLTSIHCKLFTNNKTNWSKAKIVETPSDFWNIMKLKNLGAPAKRTTITLVNYQRTRSSSYEWEWFDRPTVELRFPEGSLNGFDVKNWSRLFVHFVETCASKPFPTTLAPANFNETLQILGLKSETDISILSPGLYETLLWLLSRFSRFSKSKEVTDAAKKQWGNMTSSNMRWRFDFPQAFD